jgi:phosphoglycerol transferase MdoB-like AlkP superfamily enzyme
MADKELYNNRTLIIITADHSATFGENYLKRPSFSPSRIPLIFITPKTDIFKTIDPDLPASAVDLAPTILNLLGIQIPQTFIGRDLRNNKGIALSRTMDDELIVRSNGESFIIDLKKERPAAMPQQAYYDFFKLFYEL